MLLKIRTYLLAQSRSFSLRKRGVAQFGFILLFAFFCTLLGLNIHSRRQTVTTFALPAKEKVVMIDAGHGGCPPVPFS